MLKRSSHNKHRNAISGTCLCSELESQFRKDLLRQMMMFKYVQAALLWPDAILLYAIGAKKSCNGLDLELHSFKIIPVERCRKSLSAQIFTSNINLVEVYYMTPKRRSPNLIASQILEICVCGASKTRVVYQANLNSSIGRQYLDNMVKSGLLEEVPDGARVIYKTTSKGMSLKGRLVQYRDIMNDLYAHI